MLVIRRESIAIALLILGIVAANLVSLHVHPFRTFYNELAIIVALLLSCCVFFSNRRSVVQPVLVYGLLGLMLMMGAQLLTGFVSNYQVIYPAIYLALCVLAIFYGANFSYQGLATQLCDGVAFAHLVAAILSVVMQNIQIFGFDLRPLVMYMPIDGVVGIRPFANLAQPNQLALLLCFGLASVWWLRQRINLSGTVAALFCLLLIWGLALTQSRIGWIILPSFLLLTATKFIGARREQFLPMLILLCIYFLLVFNLQHISAWLGFSSGSVIERIGGRSERTILAQQALSMIVNHPLTGVGWFGFGPAQVDIGASFPPTIYAEHSHNFVLNITAELGLPFAIVFFGLMFLWLWKTCTPREMREKPEVAYFILFFLAVGVHSLVEFPLWYAFVLLPLMILAGVVHCLRWNRPQKMVSGQALFRVSLLGLLFVGFIVFDYQRVVAGFAEFRVAKDYSKMNVDKILRPTFTLMPDYYSYFSVMRMIPKEAMPADEIAFLESVSRRFGYVHVLSKLAEVYVLNNQVDRAKKTMLTLSRLHPYYYPEYYDYWQQLARQDERYAEVFAKMPARDLAE